MSISPTGLFQRRARMRNPLAMRKTAARLSAEIPVRNATFLFSCWRFGFTPTGGPLRDPSSAMVTLRAQRHRALIDHAPRRGGDGDDLRDAFLQPPPTDRGAPP